MIVYTINEAFSYEVFYFSIYYFIHDSFYILYPYICLSLFSYCFIVFRNLSVGVWKSHTTAFDIYNFCLFYRVGFLLIIFESLSKLLFTTFLLSCTLSANACYSGLSGMYPSDLLAFIELKL